MPEHRRRPADVEACAPDVEPAFAEKTRDLLFIDDSLFAAPLLFPEEDRYEPEPVWMLAIAFIWGATIATAVSAILNTMGGLVVGLTISEAAGEVFSAVISAPIVEETFKGLGLLIFLLVSISGLFLIGCVQVACCHVSWCDIELTWIFAVTNRHSFGATISEITVVWHVDWAGNITGNVIKAINVFVNHRLGCH